jgi:hypothetical protein
MVATGADPVAPTLILMARIVRICSKCSKELPDEGFYTIFSSWCRECTKARMAERHREQMKDPAYRDKRAEQARRWRQDNPNKAAASVSRTAARQRAKSKLAEMYPEDFQRLLQAELRGS